MREVAFDPDPPQCLTPSFFPSLFALHWTQYRPLSHLVSPPTPLLNHVKAYSTREDLVVDRFMGSVLELHASSIVLFSSTIISLVPDVEDSPYLRSISLPPRH